MSASTAPSLQRRPSRIDALVSDVFTPAVSIFLICLIAGIAGRPHHWSGMVWGLVLGMFCAVIPKVAVQLAKRKSDSPQLETSWMKKRWLAIVVSAGSLILCSAVTLWLDAPPLTVWALCTMIVGLVVSATITLTGVKTSMHSFCVTSLMMLMIVALSPWWIILALILVPAMGISRVHLGEHTPTEVIIGTTTAIILVLIAQQSMPPIS